MPDLRSQLGNELAQAAQARGWPALGLVAYREVCTGFPHCGGSELSALSATGPDLLVAMGHRSCMIYVQGS